MAPEYLGSVSKDLDGILKDIRPRLKPGNRLELAGQAALMRSSYSELIGGLGLAAVGVLPFGAVEMVAALAFIFGIAGIGDRPIPPPRTGNHTVSSIYSRAETGPLVRLAGIIHQTQSQAQKTAALFIAFLLALG